MDLTDITGLQYPQVRDERGVPVGDVAAVYADEDTDRATFVEVALVGEDRHAVVPLVGAAIIAGGLVLPFTADEVVRGPSASVAGLMPKTVLDAVLRYYGAEASNDPERGAVAKKRRRPPRRVPFKPRNLPPLNDTMPLDEDRP